MSDRSAKRRAANARRRKEQPAAASRLRDAVKERRSVERAMADRNEHVVELKGEDIRLGRELVEALDEEAVALDEFRRTLKRS